MAVVDASVWVSLFTWTDKFHQQAKDIIRPLTSNREVIRIPAIAFSEVAGVIKRTTRDSGAAEEAVNYMKNLGLEVLVDFGELEPLATKIAIKHSVKGADACYLAVAEMTRSHLHTFDKQQQEAFDAIRAAW